MFDHQSHESKQKTGHEDQKNSCVVSKNWQLWFCSQCWDGHLHFHFLIKSISTGVWSEFQLGMPFPILDTFPIYKGRSVTILNGVAVFGSCPVIHCGCNLAIHFDLTKNNLFWNSTWKLFILKSDVFKKTSCLFLFSGIIQFLTVFLLKRPIFTVLLTWKM